LNIKNSFIIAPMHLPDLVTSVPDLHTARILAAAGVGYIAFKQQIQTLSEIRPWLEGPEIGIEIVDMDTPIILADFLILPMEWYELYSFSDKRIFWKTDDPGKDEPDGMIYLKGIIKSVIEAKQGTPFLHYKDLYSQKDQPVKTWIDYEADLLLFESLFLSE